MFIFYYLPSKAKQRLERIAQALKLYSYFQKLLREYVSSSQSQEKGDQAQLHQYHPSKVKESLNHYAIFLLHQLLYSLKQFH